jgi:hypothetical protein
LYRLPKFNDNFSLEVGAMSLQGLDGAEENYGYVWSFPYAANKHKKE